MSSTRVRHPLLRLDVLASDGSCRAEHRVFCRLKSQSVRAEACCECVHCDEVIAGRTPSVDCSVPVRPLERADDPEGDRVEVGTLLRVGTGALRESATLSQALSMLHADDRRSVAVVDESSALVGIVHEAGFVGLRGPFHTMQVGASMSTPIAVHERTPVRVALRFLAATHLREVMVVSKDGIPLGVFKDVEGLRWIAGTRDRR